MWAALKIDQESISWGTLPTCTEKQGRNRNDSVLISWEREEQERIDPRMQPPALRGCQRPIRRAMLRRQKAKRTPGVISLCAWEIKGENCSWSYSSWQLPCFLASFWWPSDLLPSPGFSCPGKVPCVLVPEHMPPPPGCILLHSWCVCMAVPRVPHCVQTCPVGKPPLPVHAHGSPSIMLPRVGSRGHVMTRLPALPCTCAHACVRVQMHAPPRKVQASCSCTELLAPFCHGCL